jgi:hypothetical protein
VKIYALYVQRKESYEGEYAPELIDSVDDYTNDVNPDYIQGKLNEAKDNSEYVSAEIFEIELPSASEVIIREKLKTVTSIKGNLVI